MALILVLLCNIPSIISSDSQYYSVVGAVIRKQRLERLGCVLL
jgi:hypothetical protein